MSDENQATDTTVEETQETESTKTYTQEEFEEELKGLKLSQQKALDEAKKAKSERDELRKAQQDAQRQAMAEKEDFKGLYESQSAELEEYRTKYEQALETMRSKEVDGSALKISASIGIDESSQELLAEQAKKFIAFEDGSAVYKVGGVEVSKEEVIKTLSARYPRLVKASTPSGSGALLNNGSGAAIHRNPFKRGEGFNLTEQGRIAQEDPALAARLQKEAN